MKLASQHNFKKFKVRRASKVRSVMLYALRPLGERFASPVKRRHSAGFLGKSDGLS